MADISRPPTRRPPLGDATRRVNNSQSSQRSGDLLAVTRHRASPVSSLSQHESLKVGGLLQVTNTSPSSTPRNRNDDSQDDSPVNPRLSAISQHHSNSNRNSQISTVSTNASDGKKIKSLIGPWRLGKTLGRGATARVRLARHIHTGQEAAVKIVQKKNAQISQAGSLAALDKAISTSGNPDGLRRMPIGIEREVAIMKLIEHPNIMRLYDIWENRHEIYLVLEYVDRGELFEYIALKGRLEEKEAIKFFRQMLSAVDYCHSINICHRDLKPENILMTSSGDIKIADFGMAALHQGPGYKLRTSCGSPHYAAPELVKGNQYRGDKADIWSLGVILFAMLAGRLPFDVDAAPDKDWIPALLNQIKRGKYEMEDDFSAGARNLIQRILQVNPRDRISMEQLWKHPLVRKYEYLDDLSTGLNSPPSLAEYGRPVRRKRDIDTELLRHLRSMWHSLTEEQLVNALLSETPNEQKMFYNLFLRYRDAQLENYVPEGLGPSSSDYHHVRPAGMTKAYSTMEFASVDNQHRRQASRFTVISNVADTEYSYDPFKASRPQHLSSVHSDRAKVTILEGPSSPAIPARYSSRISGCRNRSPSPARSYASRSSIASSTRSRNITASLSYKRGVSFSHMRRGNSSIMSLGANRHSSYTEVTDDGEFLRPVAASTQYIRSRKQQNTASQPPLAQPKHVRSSLLWNEDVRQLSSTLASDCDKAFNRTSTLSEADTVRTSILSYKGASVSEGVLNDTASSSRPRATVIGEKERKTSRPLPSAPYKTNLPKENGQNMHLRPQANHLDGSGYDRRVLSAPLEHRATQNGRSLAPISEAKENTDRCCNNRIASAPERGHQARPKNTIRYVPPSSPMSPVKVPRPLVVRKVLSTPSESYSVASRHEIQNHAGKPGHERGLRKQYIADSSEKPPQLSTVNERGVDYNSKQQNDQRRSWRSSGSKHSDRSQMSIESFPIRAPNDSEKRGAQTLPSPRKKLSSRIGELFKRRRKTLKVEEVQVSTDDISYDKQSDENEDNSSSQSLRDRRIEPHQSWLAKLFNVKPVTQFICFKVTKIRARQEVTKILKEWKRYGIEDVQVDKDRNIVFGKVAPKNCLNMKQVAFAGEIMTVIEHDVRSQLSIAQFTQEQGAASSFKKVVQTLESVLHSRGLLVTDDLKKQMMIKTLNAAS